MRKGEISRIKSKHGREDVLAPNIVQTEGIYNFGKNTKLRSYVKNRNGMETIECEPRGYKGGRTGLTNALTHGAHKCVCVCVCVDEAEKDMRAGPLVEMFEMRDNTKVPSNFVSTNS